MNSEIDHHRTLIAGTETLLHDIDRHRGLEMSTTTHDAPADQRDPDMPSLE